MQKSLRKLLSLLLTLVMLLSMPLTALAEESEVSEEALPIVEEVVASEATESEETPVVEIPETEEVVIEEVPVVEETPVVEEAPVVEEVISAPVAVMAAAEEEAVLAEIAATDVAAIGDQGYATLDAAITAALPLLAEGDVTIELLSNATLTEAVEINHGSNKLTITIADSVTGPVTVTASSEAQLGITNGSVVEIKGKNAEAHIVFDGTGATFASVAAILVDGSANLTMEYVTMQNYTVSASKSGPLLVCTATVTIKNSKFLNNTGTTAGAVRCSNYTSTVQISDTLFQGNESGSNAGAVFIYSENIDADLIRCTFKENSLSSDGVGAVYVWYDSDVYLEDCVFEKNSGSLGNAMRIREGTVTMKGCSFTGNRGAGRGTVYLGNAGGKDSYTVGSLVMEDCSFSGNSSTNSSSGGDIMLWRECDVTIKGNTTMEPTGESTPAMFTNIYMAWTNGSITFEGGSAKIDTIHIPSISTYATMAVKIADVVENGATTLTLTSMPEALRFNVDGYGDNGNYTYNATVNDEDASVTGGVFEVAASDEAVLVEMWAEKNATSYVAQIGEGEDAMRFETLDAAIAKANELDEAVDVILFSDIVYDEATTLTLNGKTRLKVMGEASISGSLTLQGNGSDATVLMFYVTGGKLTLDGVTLQNYTNTGTTDNNTWGWIRVDTSGKLYLKNALIQNCTGKRGVYATSDGALIDAYNTTFKNNSSVELGGAIGLFGKAEVVAEKCTFQGNSAAAAGGAIGNNHSATSGTKVSIKDCTFTENTAATVGGAIDLYGASTLGISGTTTFTKNTANGGSAGAICLQKDCHMSIVGATFTQNVATSGKSGGVIYQASGTMSIEQSVFSKNAAENFAGAIYVTNATAATLKECSFMENEAAVAGGAVYWAGTTVGTVEGCTFTGNKAGNSCGSIYPQANATITMKDCSITGNHAGNSDGYGLYLCGKSTLENVIVKDNTTSGDGRKQVNVHKNATLTLKGANNELMNLTVAKDNASSITLAEGFGGTVTVSFSDQSLHAKYLADAETPLPLFIGDGFAAAYAAGVFTIENEAYSLLDNGHLKLNGIARVNNDYFSSIVAADTAIKSSGAAGTIVLLDTGFDVTEDILLSPGTTLDLNGQTVTSSAVGSFGAIIDSSEDSSGKIICPQKMLVVAVDNPAVPLWIDEPDTEVDGTVVPGVDHYIFATPVYMTDAVSSGDGKFTYTFLPRFTSKVEALLAEGAAAYGLTFNVNLSWNNTNTTATYPLTFNDDHVKAVYGDQQAFYATLTNYSSFEDLTIQVLIEANGPANLVKVMSATTDVQ